MSPDLYDPFKPFPRWLPMATADTFSALNRPDCHILCRWCHYNADAHPILSQLACLGTFTNHNTCRRPNPSELATQSYPGNHLRCLVGALSRLWEYLCIMSDAFGPIKRQKSGEWERQWQEWIKSLIPSFTWASRDLGSQCVCVCVCVIEPNTLCSYLLQA